MRNLEYAVAGIGSTDFASASGRSALTLAVEASREAISDAGLSAREIDGVVRCTDDTVLHNDLVEALGTGNISFWSHAGLGGTAPAAMVGQAIGAIATGQATNVLCFRAINGRSRQRFGKGWGQAGRLSGGEESGRYDEFFHPYGLTTPGQLFALIAQRHSWEYGTTAHQLAAIALACRHRANHNPHAQMFRRTLSLKEYDDARMICRPLRLYDYCLETDGACAVVVTSLDRARTGPRKPAVIAAVAQATGDRPRGGRVMPALLRDSIVSTPAKYVASLLYQRAQLGPTDVDVAQLYDCFTITVLLQLEDYGFCKEGEGGPFAESGAIELGGSLPINTSGGHLSEGYIHGMNHLVEGVRQIRGESLAQVSAAEVCLVTSGLPPASSALLLRADR